MKKSLYILPWVVFILLSFVYIHVSAKVPIHVYINDVKMESEEIVSFNTSVMVKIQLEAIEHKDIHIVLIQNDMIYKPIYEKKKKEINFAIHDDGMYQLKVYVTQEEVTTFSFNIKQQETALSFFVNDEKLKPMLYDTSSVLKVIYPSEQFDHLRSKVYINNEDYPVTWIKKEGVFTSDIVFEKEGVYKIDVILHDFHNDVHRKSTYLTIGNFTSFQYTINGEEILEDKIYYHEDVIFEGKIKWIYDEDIVDVYVNNRKVPLDSIKEDGYASFQLTFVEDGIYDITVVGRQQEFYFTLFSKQIVIDKVSPNIQYRYHEEEPKEYTTTRILYLDIYDPHIDQSSLEIMANRNGELYECNPLWLFHEDRWEVQILFDQEGMYDIFMTVQDFAGNIGIWQYQDIEEQSFQTKFIVDKTPPKVELTGITSGDVFHEKQELMLMVDDEYFASYEIVAMRNGEYYPLDIPMQGDHSIAYKHLFDEQSVGYYEIFIKAYDFAGNYTMSDKLAFTIDVKVPEVLIWFDSKPYYEGVHYLRKEALEIKVEVRDENIQSQIIRIMKDGDIILEEVDNKESNEKQFIYQLCNERYENDYELQVEVVDWAGNKVERKANFKMNAQGTSIHIMNDIFEGAPRQGPWTPIIQYDQEQFYITDCTLMKNNTLIDYVWGEPIIEDGEYILEVFARDYAGNDIAFLEAFTFVIDNTPPRIILQDKHQNAIESPTSFYRQEPFLLKTEDQRDTISSIVINKVALDIDKYKTQKDEIVYYELPILEEGNNSIEIRAIDSAGNTVYETFNIILDTLAYTKQKIIMMIIFFSVCSFSISGYVLWKKICKLRF